IRIRPSSAVLTVPSVGRRSDLLGREALEGGVLAQTELIEQEARKGRAGLLVSGQRVGDDVRLDGQPGPLPRIREQGQQLLLLGARAAPERGLDAFAAGA